MLSKIINNLKKGINEGLFRHNLNVEVIAIMRLQQVQIALDPMVFPPDKFSIKEIHVQLLIQYLHGITTLKGHKLINQYLAINED